MTSNNELSTGRIGSIYGIMGEKSEYCAGEIYGIFTRDGDSKVGASEFRVAPKTLRCIPFIKSRLKERKGSYLINVVPCSRIDSEGGLGGLRVRINP